MLLSRLVSFLVILIFASLSLYSQGQKELSQLEDSLSSIHRQILKTSNDSLRQSLNTLFRNTLRTAIGIHGSFTYPFDSLKRMSKMTSPDKMFRIYNWNLPATHGSNLYFCLLQIPQKSTKNTFKKIITII